MTKNKFENKNNPEVPFTARSIFTQPKTLRIIELYKIIGMFS